MKHIVLILSIFVYATCHAATGPEVLFFPMPQSINTKVPRHLLKPNETPVATNCILETGEASGRMGISAIHDFSAGVTPTAAYAGSVVKGFYQANSNYAIICTALESTWGYGKIYEWDYNPTVPNFIEVGTFNCTTQTFNFTNHYDDNVELCTIFTNGVDNIQKYDHVGRTVSDLIGGNQYNGKFLASFYDALYIANITVEDGVKTDDPYGIIWSEIGNAGDFNVTEYYQRRPEDGLPITALKTKGDILYLGKGSSKTKNQLWAIAPYSNFTRVSDRLGISNSFGAASGPDFYYNDKGRIFTEKGEWVSYPVHDILASALAGDWSLYLDYNTYDERLIVSSGRYLFRFSPLTKAWEQFDYTTDVKIVGASNPGIAWNSWIGPLNKHSVMSINEEDIIADSYVIWEDSILAVTNHFTDDDEGSIRSRLETISDCANDTTNQKRYQTVVLDGQYYSSPYYTADTSNEYSVYGSFTKTPQAIEWESLGTVTLDSAGHGELWIDKRGVWATLAIEVNSRNPWKLFKIGLRYTPHTQR